MQQNLNPSISVLKGLGQVWCLIVSIPDLCPLSYFHTSFESASVFKYGLA